MASLYFYAGALYLIGVAVFSSGVADAIDYYTNAWHNRSRTRRVAMCIGVVLSLAMLLILWPAVVLVHLVRFLKNSTK
jgi:uncharacterized membrane protein YdbT with pleckstrin-like domain